MKNENSEIHLEVKKKKFLNKEKLKTLKPSKRALSLALILGVGLGLTSSTFDSQAAIDLNDRRAYTTVSLYNPETKEFEYVLSTENDDKWFNKGYEVERTYTPTISGANAEKMNDSWNGIVKVSNKDGTYVAYANTDDSDDANVNEDGYYPYSWNGSSTSFDGGSVSDTDGLRLSASSADAARANTVLTTLTNELNDALNYITQGELKDLSGSDLSTNEAYLDSLMNLSNKIANSVNNGGSKVSGTITTNSEETSSCDYSGDSICYPYTVEVLTKSDYENLTDSQQSKIASTDASLVYSDNTTSDPKTVATQYILIKAVDGSGKDYLGNDAEDMAPGIGQVYLYTVPKGYDSDEILGKYVTDNLNLANEAGGNYIDIGITNNYTIPMIIGQALSVYTNESTVANSSFDAEAFKVSAESESDLEDDTFLSKLVTKLGNLLYSVIGVYPMNEVLSPFENGMRYNWTYGFIPPVLVGLVSVLSGIVLTVTVIILSIITIQRVFHVRNNRYNAEEMKPAELFRDVIFVSLAAVVNVIMVPFYMYVGSLFVSLFMLLGTPTGVAPGTYEIGAGLFGNTFGTFGYIASWAMGVIFFGLILFALFQILLRYIFGTIFAIGFFDSKDGSFWEKFGKYHASLLWLCVGKFAIWGMGYAMLANIQYQEDLGIVVGITLISMVNNLPSIIEKMLGLKLFNIEEGTAHAMAGAAGASKAVNHSKTTGKAATWAGDAKHKRTSDAIKTKEGSVAALNEKVANGTANAADISQLAKDSSDLSKLKNKSDNEIKAGKIWNNAGGAAFFGKRSQAGSEDYNDLTAEQNGGAASNEAVADGLREASGLDENDFKAGMMLRKNALDSDGEFDESKVQAKLSNLSDEEKKQYAGKFDKLKGDEKADTLNAEALAQLGNASNKHEATRAAAFLNKTARTESQRQMQGNIAESQIQAKAATDNKNLTEGEFKKVSADSTFGNGQIVSGEDRVIRGDVGRNQVPGQEEKVPSLSQMKQPIMNGKAMNFTSNGQDGALVDVAVSDDLAFDLGNSDQHVHSSASELKEAISSGEANGGMYKTATGEIRQMEFAAGDYAADSDGALLSNTKDVGKLQQQTENRRLEALKAGGDNNNTAYNKGIANNAKSGGNRNGSNSSKANNSAGESQASPFESQGQKKQQNKSNGNNNPFEA